MMKREEFDEALEMPRFVPPVTRVTAGMDGSIWLRREELPGVETVTWAVLAEDGTPLFSLTTPRDLWIYAATTSHIWGILPDSLDVPFVVRYRVK